MRRALQGSAALVALALLLGGCGGPDQPVESLPPPPKVPVSVVPTALSNGDITLHENIDKETLDAFANAGKDSLVADGRLWELRRGAQLVGALQVATVARRVDLAEADQRREMLSQILPGNLNQLVIDDVPVWAAETNDKVVYVWFATSMFEVLQLKGTRIEPEAVLREVIAHERASDEFLPLPPEAYGDA